MDPQIKAQLRQVIRYASTATVDFSGQVQVGSTATAFARVQPRYREVPVGSGVIEERTQHTIILAEDFPLTEDEARAAWYYLPGVDQARRAKIAHYCYGPEGELDHIEVAL